MSIKDRIDRIADTIVEELINDMNFQELVADAMREQRDLNGAVALLVGDHEYTTNGTEDEVSAIQSTFQTMIAQYVLSLAATKLYNPSTRW